MRFLLLLVVAQCAILQQEIVGQNLETDGTPNLVAYELQQKVINAELELQTKTDVWNKERALLEKQISQLEENNAQLRIKASECEYLKQFNYQEIISTLYKQLNESQMKLTDATIKLEKSIQLEHELSMCRNYSMFKDKEISILISEALEYSQKITELEDRIVYCDENSNCDKAVSEVNHENGMLKAEATELEQTMEKIIKISSLKITQLRDKLKGCVRVKVLRQDFTLQQQRLAL